MADASTGQPLHSRHLVALRAAQTVQGTAVTPNLAVGLMDADVTSEGGISAVFGLGSQDAIFIQEGAISTPFHLPIREIQDKAVIIAAAAAVPLYHTHFWGYVDDVTPTPNKHGYQVRDCMYHNWTLEGSEGEPFRLDVEGVGGLITEPTNLTATNFSLRPLKWHEAIFTKGGSAYQLQGIRVSQVRNVELQHLIYGTAPADYKRGWRFQTPGNSEVSFELTRFEKSAVNLQADTLSDFAMVLTITGSVTLTVTFAGAKFGSERFSGEIGGIATYTTPGLAKTVAVT